MLLYLKALNIDSLHELISKNVARKSLAHLMKSEIAGANEKGLSLLL